MKRYISAILIPCLLLQIYSCYSMKSVKVDEQLENCEKVSNKEFIVYGTGTLTDKKTSKDKIFRGQLDNTMIDSMKMISVNSTSYLVCWLKDSTRVSFKRNEYVTFNLNPQKSYWIVKDVESPHSFIDNGDNEVNEVKVEQLDTAPTILLVLGLGVLVTVTVLFIALGNALSGFNSK